MKKRVLLLLILAVVFTGKMSAQKGMNGIGISVPVGYFSEMKVDNNKAKKMGGLYAGIGIKYFYNLTDYFRIEPSAEYSWSTPSYSLKSMLNFNLFLKAPNPVRPYLIAGAGYLMERYEYTNDKGGRHYQNGIGMNFGLGLDCRISHTLSMQFEATATGIITGDYYKTWAFVGRWGLTCNF